MNSIGGSCNDLKHQYDECFQSWFTNKFLKGEVSEDVCDPLFKLYQQCIQKTMKEHHIEVKDTEVNHLGTDKEYKPPMRDKGK